MTSVMRAVARPTGSRALRAALVRGGRIVDERVVAAGEHLTVGSTERSTFVVAGLGSSFRVLEWTRSGYKLHLAPGMSGRVAVGGEVAEVGGAAGSRAPIALDDEARGKIALGDALLLFHFVVPQAAAPRAQLPLAVRRGAFDGLDWKTTIIAAFSFLFHFGLVGSAYADFADTTIDEDGARVATVIGMLHDLPKPPLETPAEEGKTADNGKPKDADHPAPHPRPGPRQAEPGQQPRRRRALGRRAPRRRAGPGDRPAARARGAAMLMAIGGGEGHRSIDRVMDGSDMPMLPVGDAARDPGGTRTGGVAGLNLGSGTGGPIRVGDHGHGMAVADLGRDGHADETGVVNAPKKPIPGTSVDPPTVPVGRLPGAGKAVAGMRGLLRQCFKHELDRDPNARGTVRVTAKIGSNGEVTSVQVANGGLSSEMGSCVSRVVSGADFGPPQDGGAAMVTIPMTFIPQ